MWYNTLYVLLWKCMCVRRRRFISTICEILSVLPFFLILYFCKDFFIPNDSGPASIARQNESIIPMMDEYDINDVGALNLIIYMPDTEIANKLMDEVGRKLELSRVDGSKNPKRGYYGLPANTDLTSYYKKMGHDEAIVIFKDMEGTDLPLKLEYTIRMIENFITGSYKPFDNNVYESHEDFGGIYDKFMRLQWTLDSTFLELASRTNITQKVTLQEFPRSRNTVANKDSTILLISVVPFMAFSSLLVMSVFLSNRLLEERLSGAQELIKMSGVSTNLIGLSHFLNTLPVGIIFSVVGTTFVKISATPIIAKTNFLLIFFTLFLYFLTMVSFGFFVSYMVMKTSYRTTLLVLLYFATYSIAEYATGKTTEFFTHVLGLAPHIPIFWVFHDITTTEVYGVGASLTTKAPLNGAILTAYIFCIIQIVLYITGACYLERVIPQKYGVTLPWNFFMKPDYWRKSNVNPIDIEETELTPTNRDSEYFERAPAGAVAGIVVKQLSKEYGSWGGKKTRALTNVSLEVYQGEITVLLGHNGAGKTTLMSILTGMSSPSAGSVHVNGRVGFCPQHNLYFNDLTVYQHLMFFSMLWGMRGQKAVLSADSLTKRVGLSPQRDVTPAALSGGMKRRLQVACAAAGDAEVLILDEPTAGLDIETRRGLWDLLLSLRGSHCLLLSTHHIEEADALADRVIALHASALRCHATPMHLRRAIGSGYQLSLTTENLPKVDEISTIIKQHVPEAVVTDTSLRAITYKLPASSTDKFANMFKDLEAKKTELGIMSFGIGVTTLEEVFLKLCRDVDVDVVDGGVPYTALDDKRKLITGPTLWKRQIKVLLQRQMAYSRSTWLGLLIVQILLPMAAIFAVCYYYNNDKSEIHALNRDLPLNLDVYNPKDHPTVFYKLDPAVRDAVDWEKITKNYPNANFKRVDDVGRDVIESGAYEPNEYSLNAFSLDINDSSAHIQFTTTVRHAAPIAVNLLSNVLAAVTLSPERTVTAHNDPIDLNRRQMTKLVEPKSRLLMLGLYAFTVLLFLSVMTDQIALMCAERESTSRLILKISGASPAILWISTILYLTALVLVIFIIPALGFTAFLDKDSTTNSAAYIGELFLLLTLGGITFLVSIGFISYLFSKSTATVLIIAINLVIGMIGVLTFESELTGQKTGVWITVGRISEFLIPSVTLLRGAGRAGELARTDAMCQLNRHLCPFIPADASVLDVEKCCGSPGSIVNYMSVANGVGKHHIILLVQLVVFSVLIALCESGKLSLLWDRMCTSLLCRYRPDAVRDAGPLVTAEKQYVQSAMANPKKNTDAMLAHDLHKSYVNILGKRTNALRGINFSVKHGECFGLLGVNGAGKSTAFKILTGEIAPTRGTAIADGHLLHKNRGQYLSSLGYCPQHSALDGFLTGGQTMNLVLTLRGYDDQKIKEETDVWFRALGLERYAATASGQYSGGCARRLSAAVALAGPQRLALLDEPAAGMDAPSRARLRASLTGSPRGILLSSHAIQESESSCQRLSILRAGWVAALGAPAELRHQHASGTTMRVKLTPGDNAAIETLKNTLKSKFDCTLLDENRTTLSYRIKDRIPYSELFSRVNEIKQAFPCIEDYSISETTLEEVFLNIAKETDVAPHSNNV